MNDKFILKQFKRFTVNNNYNNNINDNNTQL